MRAPNNVLCMAATAMFDETYFPKCPDGKHPCGPTQTGEEPDPSNNDDIFHPPTPPNHTSINGDGPDLENDEYAEEPADLELPNPPPEIMEEQPRRGRARQVPVALAHGDRRRGVQRIAEGEVLGPAAADDVGLLVERAVATAYEGVGDFARAPDAAGPREGAPAASSFKGLGFISSPNSGLR